MDFRLWRRYHCNFLEKRKKSKTIDDLETKLKDYEKLENYADNIDYKVCKLQLDEIYEKKQKV